MPFFAQFRFGRTIRILTQPGDMLRESLKYLQNRRRWLRSAGSRGTLVLVRLHFAINERIALLGRPDAVNGSNNSNSLAICSKNAKRVIRNTHDIRRFSRRARVRSGTCLIRLLQLLRGRRPVRFPAPFPASFSHPREPQEATRE